VRTSESIAELAAALSAAQGSEDTDLFRNSKNPAFKSTYADLEAVTDVVRPLLKANGLSVVQLPGLSHQQDGTTYATVVTRLMHTSGQWLEVEASSPLQRPDAQGVGSVTTYLRRYGLMGLFALAPEDDDGNAAVGGQGGASPAQQYSAPAPVGTGGTGGALTPGDFQLWMKPYEKVWLSECNDIEYLERVVAFTRRNIADPAKATYKAKNEKELALVEQHLARVKEAADAPPF